jgi:hypothetical protein
LEVSRTKQYRVLIPDCRLVGPDDSAPTSSSFKLAKRLDTLDGKRIYLVDTGFGGSYVFMQQLQKWFAEHMPQVTTVRRRKPGNVFMDDTDVLWQEIAAEGHGAVLGVGG